MHTFDGEWRGYCNCIAGVMFKISHMSRQDQFEYLWAETLRDIKEVEAYFVPIHARFKKKEGYSPQDEALLKELRNELQCVGNFRYQLLKDYSDTL